MLRIVISCLCFCGVACAQEPAPAGQTTNGVVVFFQQGNTSDAVVLPNLALFVAPGSAPAAFLAPGPFHAELRGFLSVELRASYTFRAVAQGDLEFFVNGAPVLNFTGEGKLSEPSKPVRLNRGRNPVVLRFKSPAHGDARFQILWASKNWPLAIPIPTESLSFESDPVLLKQTQLHQGLELLTEYRCLRCHSTEKPVRPEFDKDAPDFEEIGSRLNANWMARWIAEPFTPGAHMPRLFLDHETPRAIAAYLSTLTSNAVPASPQGNSSRGEELFKNLRCAACHADQDPALAGVREKFKAGALSAFLRNPQAHYRGNPMPNFKLSDGEADDLAAHLETHAATPNTGQVSGSIEAGRNAIQSGGCLNCHRSTLENKYSAPSLNRIASAGLQGCLSTNETARAPRFKLNIEQKLALAAFLDADNFASLTNFVPHEIALHDIERLGCAGCHEKVEGLPRISRVGAKLKPEWAARFISGEVNYKPRPWMAARMPAFPSDAKVLATGLAALHGYPATTRGEPAIDKQLVQIGAKLVSAAGGFSCVACHAVGSFTSGQVVETPGVNLAYSGERLLPDYFKRWVMNPVAIDPNTKMPVYFDAQGRSQLTEIFEGDGAKQIEAIRDYVRLGSQMPPPGTP